MTEKKCSKCGEVKGVGEFYKDKRQKDGYKIYCIKCLNELSEKQYEIKNGKKRCANCRELYNSENFYLKYIKKRHGGECCTLDNFCKSCRKMYNSEMRSKYVKKIFPCKHCGRRISREKSYCSICNVKLFKKPKSKYKGVKIKCDWCKKEKTNKSYSHGSLSNYGAGKKVYCINCTSKYYEEIRTKYEEDGRIKRKIELFFEKKKNEKYFKRYLSRATDDMLKFIKSIDHESYDYAIELKRKTEEKKKERRMKYEKKRREKLSIRRKTDPWEIQIDNKLYNINTTPPELKPVIKAMLAIKKKKNYIREVKNNG